MWDGDPKAKNKNDADPIKRPTGRVAPAVTVTKADVDQEKADAWISKAKQEGRWPPVDVPDFVKPYVELLNGTYVAVPYSTVDGPFPAESAKPNPVNRFETVEERDIRVKLEATQTAQSQVNQDAKRGPFANASSDRAYPGNKGEYAPTPPAHVETVQEKAERDRRNAAYPKPKK